MWEKNTYQKGQRMDIILSAKNLNRDFKIGDGSTVHALKNINLEIEKGKLTVLRGRSGSGKTTLINILGALDKPTSGEVIFKNRDIARLSEKKRDDLRRYDMAFVFQSVALMSSMTAVENVELGLRLSKYKETNRTERAKECLKAVGLEKRMEHIPSEMSGGEQQRVAVARAFSHKPSIIFADEPTAELDTNTSLQIVKLFKKLVADYGMTIIMTTHDPGMMDIADRVLTLEDGELVDG